MYILYKMVLCWDMVWFGFKTKLDKSIEICIVNIYSWIDKGLGYKIKGKHIYYITANHKI